MTRYFFSATDSANYDGANNLDNTDNDDSTYINQGHTDEWEADGNWRSIVLFNSSAIRAALVGQRVTSCALTFDVQHFGCSGTVSHVIVGTHNYTSYPGTWVDSRVNQDRLRRYPTYRGIVSEFPLGTTIGTEFRDGVSTGIAFGPAPAGSTGDNTYYAGIVRHGKPTGPVLVIDAVLINAAPYAPTLLSPADNVVLDTANNDVNLQWAHNDPNGDAQAAWRVRRTRHDGSFDWWNGTAFQNTEVRLTQSTAPLTAGVLTIPAGLWATNLHYGWSVATEDPSGLIGPYSGARVIYSSVPPTVAVTAPTTPSNAAQPLVSWTFADADGTPQYGWQAQVVESSVYSAVGYNPDNYLNQAWSSSGLGATPAVQTNVNLKNHKTYRAYVKVTSSPNPSGGLQNSTWSYIQFDVVIPPYAPVITYPQNGGNVDLAAGFTFSWVGNYFADIGTQSGFAIRRNVGVDPYQWWNGATWGLVEVFLGGANTSYAFRTNEIVNGATYTFAVAIRDDFSQQSPYSVGVTVVGATTAQVTVLSPLGSAAVNNPIVTWSIFQAQNYPQQTWRVRILTSATYTGLTIDPLTALSVWDSGEVTDSAGRAVTVPTNLSNANEYRAYVRVKTAGIYSGWAYAQFTVSLVPPATPFAYTVVRSELGAIDVVIQGGDSMLTEDASRNATGWQSQTNCVVTNSAFYASSQSKLISNLTASATGTMAANSSAAYPVAPGLQYTAAATLLAGVGEVPVNGYVSIEFYDIGNVFISVVSSTVVNDAAAVRASVVTVAPSNAATARIRVTFQNVVATGDIHSFFDPVLRPGTGIEWSPGGMLGLTYITVSERNDSRPLRWGQDILVPALTQQIAVRDEEVAVGRSMVYLVSTRVVHPTSALVSDTQTLAGAVWTSGWLWLSDPHRVGSGRPFGPQSFTAITRPVRQGKFRPISRPDAIITTGVRGLREGSYTIVTADRADRTAHLDLITNSEVILLRVPPDQGDNEGETIYVRVEGDTPETRLSSSRTPQRGITQSWTEQLRPTTEMLYGNPT